MSRRKTPEEIAIAEAVAERLEGLVKTEYIVARKEGQRNAEWQQDGNHPSDVKITIEKGGRQKVDIQVNCG